MIRKKVLPAKTRTRTWYVHYLNRDSKLEFLFDLEAFTYSEAVPKARRSCIGRGLVWDRMFVFSNNRHGVKI